MDSGRVNGSDDVIATLSSRVSELSKRVALLQSELESAQKRHDVVACEEVLREAFFTDVEPLLRQVRQKLSCPVNPVAAYRASGYEAAAAKTRTAKRKALGVTGESSYA